MNVYMHQPGTAVPEHSMSQSDALQMTQDIACDNERQRRLASMLFNRSGVASRHTAVPHPIAYQWAESKDGQRSLGPTTRERMELYSRYGPPIAAAAARIALSNGNVRAEQVTHLVTVSCTGFDAPGADISLYQSLGLRSTVERVHVGFMGCHGAINGLRAARALAAQDASHVVLLSALELCSLHYRFTWDDEGIIGNALFADGSAGVVVTSQPPVNGSCWRVRASGSCLLPDSTDAMTWQLGNHGFEMRLTSEVPAKIEAHLRNWMSAWLAKENLTIDDIVHWAIHPGGPRILTAAETALGLTEERTVLSRSILSEFGNMSSPTVLFILERLGRSRPSGPCVMLGFGPGLMAEACLVEPIQG